VTQSDSLDRWEIITAVIGLRGAFRRCISAYHDMIPHQELAGVAVVEFVVWACALDERLRKTDPSYAARRDADDYGRVLPALRFARDRHLHQVTITTSLVFTVGWSKADSTPDLIGGQIYWRKLDDITEPTDGRERKPDYLARRTAYKEHLEGREPRLAMGHALDFLNREVAARGIEVQEPPDWHTMESQGADLRADLR
jgi:hypothetical protein